MSSKTQKQSPMHPTDEKEFIRLEKGLEHLRIMLSVEMKDLRNRREVTQAQLAERLGCNQSWVSKVESADQNTGIESILRYLFEMEADLVLGILDDQKFLPVTEAAESWWKDREKWGCFDEASLPPKSANTEPKEKLRQLEKGAKESVTGAIHSRGVANPEFKVAG